jgi:hypothetical protein
MKTTVIYQQRCGRSLSHYKNYNDHFLSTDNDDDDDDDDNDDDDDDDDDLFNLFMLFWSHLIVSKTG